MCVCAITGPGIKGIQDKVRDDPILFIPGGDWKCNKGNITLKTFVSAERILTTIGLDLGSKMRSEEAV